MSNKWPSHFQTSKPNYYIIVHGLTMMASTACLASFSDTICSDSHGTWLLWKLSQIIFLWKIIGNFQIVTGGACGRRPPSLSPLLYPPPSHSLLPLLGARRRLLFLFFLLLPLSHVQKSIKERISGLLGDLGLYPPVLMHDANKPPIHELCLLLCMSNRGKE